MDIKTDNIQMAYIWEADVIDTSSQESTFNFLSDESAITHNLLETAHAAWRHSWRYFNPVTDDNRVARKLLDSYVNQDLAPGESTVPVPVPDLPEITIASLHRRPELYFGTARDDKKLLAQSGVRLEANKLVFDPLRMAQLTGTEEED